MSCQGIYADVQILTERLAKTPGNQLHTNGASTFDIKILDEIEKLRASIEGEEIRGDIETVSRLLKQYNEFKMKNLPNYRFNPKKPETQYGR